MERRSLGLSSTGFRAYLATQFLGAFNDNTYKFLLISLIFARAAGDPVFEHRHVGLAQALFSLPFVLFAGWAGALADRYRKSAIFIAAKIAEISIMVAVGVAFLADDGVALMALLFLMGLHSTFFGPAKYGYLAEQVDEHDLSRANGLVNMTTMGAVVLGQVAGGALFDVFEDHLERAAAVLVGVAVLGLVTAMGVPRVQAADPNARLANPLPGLMKTWREVRHSRGLLYTMLGIGHFWLLAALLQLQLVSYAEHVLGATSHAEQSTFVGVTTVGIALGSLLASRWSERKVELGLVPLGVLGMSAFLVVLAFAPGTGAPAIVGSGVRLLDVVPAYLASLGLGAAGGLFIVPLLANLQVLAPEDGKGRFLAFGNMVSFIGIFLAAGAFWLLGEAQFTPREQALVVAAVTVLGAVVSLRLLPEAFLRFCGWLLAHSLYRIRVLHPERIPEKGGALLVANHVSWVDWLVLAATTRRRVRFLIYRQYFEWWPLRSLFRLAHCIPIASGDDPAVMAESVAEAGRALQEGHIVCIFAEGAVTRTGHLQTFRRGYQRIVQDIGIPIIPVHLDGLWGSIFSHERGKLLFKVPRAVPYPVTVSFGEPLPPRAEPYQLRDAIQRLASDAWDVRKESRQPLHLTLLREGRRSLRGAFFEAGLPPLSRGALIARSLAARDALLPRLGAARHVGVLLPNGRSGAIAVLAVLFAGRVPVPVNTTLPADELAEALRRAGIDTVITDEAGRARSEVCGLQACVDVASLTGRPVRWLVWSWTLLCWVLPQRLLDRLALVGARPTMDDPAVVLFSAGSTGPAKGVVLSHQNVMADVEASQEVLDLDHDDRVFALLPFFHVVGFVQTLWLPLLTDAGAIYHADPLDGRTVGKLVTRFHATVLWATPRLLERYLRLARADHFGCLRIVFTTGEKLPPLLRVAFEERFGLQPYEAYTSTECSSVVALGTPDVRAAGVFQRGSRHGAVGHPLPGVTVEVVDGLSGELLPPGTAGMLRVRGPEVMRGYLDDPARETAVLRDGFYVSGDRASLDEEGFLTLTDRFERITQVDGERVSLGAVEDAIAYQLGTPESPVAVLAQPDRERGHALAVFYARGSLDPSRIVDGLLQRGLPPAWCPRLQDFVAVDEIPLLPTGIVDHALLRAALAPRAPG